MEQTDFTVRTQNQSDEYGIFLSVLYLAGESHKRKMILTTATLLTAAQSIIDDCDGNGSLANDLSAALTFYKQAIKHGNYDTLKKM